MRVFVGGHDVEDIVLDPFRLQRAVPAADQSGLEEAATSRVVLPTLELVALEQRLEVRRTVGGDVKDDRGVLAGHDWIVTLSDSGHGWPQRVVQLDGPSGDGGPPEVVQDAPAPGLAHLSRQGVVGE